MHRECDTIYALPYYKKRMEKRYYNPQTNVFDYLKKKRRSWDWYDSIWKTVGKCVFCDLKERYIIFEKNGIVLTTNLFPYTDAHLLIIPRRHIEYVKQFSPHEWEALRGVMYVAKKVLRRVFKKKNVWFLYREGALGQAQKTVGHVHIQVVPYVEKLFTINYQPISWAPGEVGDRLKEEHSFMEKKFEKYVRKYGKYSLVEKRILVTAAILNSEGDVLLVKKKHSPDKKWELPGGSLEGDESLLQALTREIYEETNISVKNIHFIGIDEVIKDQYFEEGFVQKWKLFVMQYKAMYAKGKLKAGDDVREAKWVKPTLLKRYTLSPITKKIFKKMKIL
jgi:ADP-ribose pyrophosphatase YjhB (NUDIX family)/diadenosine tetraphosphate (Ap4A) HIT family hydrolase